MLEHVEPRPREKLDSDSIGPVAVSDAASEPLAASAQQARANNRVETALIFGGSVLLHLFFASHLHSNSPDRARTPRVQSKVAIEFARPEPKVIPPEPPKPEPPKPETKAKPQHATSSKPVIPLANVAKMEGPSSDEPSDAPPAEEAPVAAVNVAYDPGPPKPEVTAPPPPAPIIEAREGANYLANPRPAYPKLAMRQGWEGTVLLRVHVLPTGRPDAVTLQRTSGHDMLDEVAQDTVKGWTFSPATQGGKAIAGWVNVPIVFRLQ
jgi:protein TonB